MLAGAGFDEALVEALARAEETGATFVHAFEDETVIAGQGTIGLELADELPDVEHLPLPIGGGGLAAGIAIALRALRPGVRIVGVQAGRRGAARSPTASPSSTRATLTMSILDDLLDDIVHVEDEEICEAITLAARAGEARRRGRGCRVGRRAARRQGGRRAAKSARCSRAGTSTRRC